MKFTDILSAAPGGRAQVHVEGYPATVLLPTTFHDYHAMGRIQRWFVGQMTPAMTWRNGIAVNERALQLQVPRAIVEMFVHENVHWWQLWRRMGPTDFPATYGWQGLIRLFKTGSAHIHDDHPVEVEARRIAGEVMAEIDRLLLTASPVTFDLVPWLAAHLPATRS